MKPPIVRIGADPELEHQRLPAHCIRPQRRTPEIASLQRRLRKEGLHSVCEEARCPNRSECWTQGHVTFMLLGRVCTRACRFCAVITGLPSAPPDPDEPRRVARTAASLGLSHVVLTSVNRDDLPDGGSAHYAETIRALRDESPSVRVEVLTPDFQGDRKSVERVCAASPDVFNHNVETVPRLYKRVRPGSRLDRSLDVLAHARRLRPAAVVKSGLMVGLGENEEEVVEVLDLLRGAGVDSVTIGQYLRPSRHHLPVDRYWEPDEFRTLAARARAMGFAQVASGPLVRSSYRAADAYDEVSANRSAEEEACPSRFATTSTS
ncbi:lipoyl synthase [Myxococcota bacterium]|nr:lipoyl synthase [Myxococcota bacterium]